MDFFKYEVGREFPGSKSIQEGTFFDISDDGALLLLNYDSPTEKEKEQIKSNHPFHIGYTVFNNVIWFTIKIGDLPWNDSPYTPHLSKNLTNIPQVKDGMGLGLTVILADRRTGIISNIRTIGLGTNFSKSLFADIENILNTTFDKDLYNFEINRMMRAYTTGQLVKFCKNYYKI